MNRIYYKFFDTDIYGTAEYDIRGDELRALFDKCFEYSQFLSLDFNYLLRVCSGISYCDVVNDPYLKQLDTFRISMPHNAPKYKYINDKKYDAEGDSPSVRYYRLCPELKELLLSMVSGIFDFGSSKGRIVPEDPIFYRSDGSMFMFSEIHEGEVVLIPRNDENVLDIVSNELWYLNPRNPYTGKLETRYFDFSEKEEQRD